MKTYHLEVTYSTMIEAESEEQAKRIALDRLNCGYAPQVTVVDVEDAEE